MCLAVCDAKIFSDCATLFSTTPSLSWPGPIDLDELSGDEPADAVLPGARASRPRPSCRGAASAAQLASRSPNPIAVARGMHGAAVRHCGGGAAQGRVVDRSRST